MPLQRKTWLKRKSAKSKKGKPLAAKRPMKPRQKRIRPRNPERAKKTLERAYGSEERRAWIKRQPSVASGKRPCEQAHVGGGGTGYKGNAEWVVPLTHHEHMEELHKWGQKTFEKHYGINLRDAAEATARAWQSHRRKKGEER